MEFFLVASGLFIYEMGLMTLHLLGNVVEKLWTCLEALKNVLACFLRLYFTFYCDDDMCVRACLPSCMRVGVWSWCNGRLDITGRLAGVSSPLTVGPADGTQVGRLGCQHLYPLCPLAGPFMRFKLQNYPEPNTQKIALQTSFLSPRYLVN